MRVFKRRRVPCPACGRRVWETRLAKPRKPIEVVRPKIRVICPCCATPAWEAEMARRLKADALETNRHAAVGKGCGYPAMPKEPVTALSDDEFVRIFLPLAGRLQGIFDEIISEAQRRGLIAPRGARAQLAAPPPPAPQPAPSASAEEPASEDAQALEQLDACLDAYLDEEILRLVREG